MHTDSQPVFFDSNYRQKQSLSRLSGGGAASAQLRTSRIADCPAGKCRTASACDAQCIAQSLRWQFDSKALRNHFRGFQSSRGWEPVLTPGLEPTFQDPYLVNAYLLQSHRGSRAYNIASRRTVENDFDISRNIDLRRFLQARRIYTEGSRNGFHAPLIVFFFEGQEVKHCNLRIGVQFVFKLRRTDAALP